MTDAFTLESFQNPYLAEDTARVDAIVSVTATDALAAAAPAQSLLLGFIIDTSGSMEGDRIAAVRGAAQAAIQLLNDQDQFFIVNFANYARVVVPTTRATPPA